MGFKENGLSVGMSEENNRSIPSFFSCWLNNPLDRVP